MGIHDGMGWMDWIGQIEGMMCEQMMSEGRASDGEVWVDLWQDSMDRLERDLCRNMWIVKMLR